MQPSCAEEAEAQGEAEPAVQRFVLSELNHQIQYVADERRVLQDDVNELAARRADFEAENEDLIDAVAHRRAALAEAETRLRDLTLAAYRATGDKKPAPGVGVRVLKTVEYDPLEARRWAASKGACLALDAKAFEAAVLAGIFDDAPGRVVEKAQATIAREL